MIGRGRRSKLKTSVWHSPARAETPSLACYCADLYGSEVDIVAAWWASNWFNVVGLAVGVLGLAAGLYAWFRPRQSKRLEWDGSDRVRIIQDIPVGGAPIGLKVLYGTEDVSDPHVSMIRVRNSGLEEIRPTDFDRPIRIACKAKILALSVSQRSNEQITVNPSVDTSGTEATVAPTLLNAAEWFELQMLTDGDPDPQLTARVAGETEQLAEVDMRLMYFAESPVSTSRKVRAVLIFLMPPFVVALDALVRSGRVGILNFLGPPPGEQAAPVTVIWLLYGVLWLVSFYFLYYVFAPPAFKYRVSRRLTRRRKPNKTQ